MDRPRRPAPEPLDVDVVSVVALGTAIWFVAFVVLLPFHGRLDGAGHDDWFWTSLAGWVLGIVGILVARAQRAARRAAAGPGNRSESRPDAGSDAGSGAGSGAGPDARSDSGPEAGSEARPGARSDSQDGTAPRQGG